MTDAGLASLTEMSKLRKLYLWQSQVTKEGAGELVVLIPDLEVNLGYDPPPEPKGEEKKEEEKKEEIKDD